MNTDAVETSESWHGTPGGYTNRACRCDGCRNAHAAYQRDYYAIYGRRKYPKAQRMKAEQS